MLASSPLATFSSHRAHQSQSLYKLNPTTAYPRPASERLRSPRRRDVILPGNFPHTYGLFGFLLSKTTLSHLHLFRQTTSHPSETPLLIHGGNGSNRKTVFSLLTTRLPIPSQLSPDPPLPPKAEGRKPSLASALHPVLAHVPGSRFLLTLPPFSPSTIYISPSVGSFPLACARACHPSLKKVSIEVKDLSTLPPAPTTATPGLGCPSRLDVF